MAEGRRRAVHAAPDRRTQRTARRQRPGASRVLSSMLAAVLAGLVALAASTGEPWLVAAAVLLVQLLVAAAPAPPDVRRRSAPRWWPVAAGGAVATWVALDPVLLVGPDGVQAGRDALLASGVLAGMLPGAVVVVLLTLVGQMLRRDGRGDLTLTTSHTVTLGLLATLASGWVAASRAPLADQVVVMGVASVAVTLAVWSVVRSGLGLHAGPGAAAAVLAGAAAGASVPWLVDGWATWVLGVSIGLGAACSALLGQVVARLWAADRWSSPDGWGLGAALSVALAGPVVHVGAQLSGLTF